MTYSKECNRILYQSHNLISIQHTTRRGLLCNLTFENTPKEILETRSLVSIRLLGTLLILGAEKRQPS